MILEPVQELEHARLRRPLQASVVHVLQPKPHARAQSPLEVIENSLRRLVASCLR